MFQSGRGVHQILSDNTSDEEDNDINEHIPHPTDISSSCISWIWNSFLYIWVFKIMRIGKIELDDLPSLPRNLNANKVYKHWKNVFKTLKQQNSSTSTLSMIWQTQKFEIILLTIIELFGYSLVLFASLIFKNSIMPLINSIDNNNNNYHQQLTDIAKFATILFLISCAKTMLCTFSTKMSQEIAMKVESSLLMSVYHKTLSLHLSECDRQQVLSIVGNDIIHSIRIALFYVLSFGPVLPLLLITSIIAMCFIIGVSAIFGIIFMILVGIPFQLFGGYKFAHYANLRMISCDKRVQLITELIRGIRILKLSCYELPVMDRINEYRTNELSHISKRNFYLSIIVLANFLIPAIMLLIILLVYCFGFKYSINSNITVFMLILFSIIQIAIKTLPVVMGELVNLLVSCGRVDTFYERKSVDIDSQSHQLDSSVSSVSNVSIEMNNASFVWEESEQNDKKSKKFSLKNIRMKLNKNKLIAIIGSVGSGKTSLIQSILGEMKCITGNININSDESIVYCSQTPYIRNVTLRENILMELPFDETKYKKCILASALYSDLQKLPNYDLTLIGDEGVNISGGQKMRIAFARSLYRKEINDTKHQIYIYDDPLSSVDIYVGKHMFFNGIYSHIMNRESDNNITNNVTCLMVINSHLHLLKYFDEIIIIDNGEIKIHDTVNHLFFNDDHKENNLYKQYKHLLPKMDQIKFDVDDDKKYDLDEELVFDRNVSFDQQNKNIMNLYKLYDKPIVNWNSFVKFIKCSFTKFDYNAFWYDKTEEMQNVEKGLTDNTKMFKVSLLLIISFVSLCSAPVCDLWILYWNQHLNDDNNLWYLFIWFLLLCVIAFGTLYSMRLFGDISMKSSHYIHSKALYNILRANTLFFDMTPRGDILRRFTTDTHIMDVAFTDQVYQCVLFLSSTIGYFIIIMVFIPLSMIPICIIAPVLFYLNYRFDMTYFSCLSLENQTKSQIITLFAETVTSLDSIRAHELQSFFVQDLVNRIHVNLKCGSLALYVGSFCVLMQETVLNCLQFLLIIASVYQIVIDHENENTSHKRQFIVLSCWYIMSIQSQINFALETYCYAKKNFTSITNLLYYHDLFDKNKKLGKEIMFESKQINYDYSIKQETKWPNIGNININRIQLRYRKKFDIALDIDRNIKIKNGHKIGICGRTGSGKSSILVSIFRLFEPIINNVVIDDYRIDKLGLYDLRSNLSIIAQNPILFNGSLRFNLDPFDKYSDNEIWNALKNVQLFELINNRNGKLMCNVEANGNNFSGGEKQLLCFARAVLSKSKVLFMDEATSSVDLHTDTIIQNLIRSEQFKNITVICIAHRLQTIIDYDYILLLKNGKIQQFDSPQNLLNDKNGDFSKLVKIDMLYNKSKS